MIAWEEVKAMQVKDIRLGFTSLKPTEGIDNVDPDFDAIGKNQKNQELSAGPIIFYCL